MSIFRRIRARRLARRVDDIRLVTWWQALGADVRAERASLAADIGDRAETLEEQ